MVRGENNRKQNKRRNKARIHPAGLNRIENGDVSDSSTSSSGSPTRRNDKFLTNLSMDLDSYRLLMTQTRLQDAEKKFYSFKVCLM